MYAAKGRSAIATIRDVAKRAGVSVATVSAVINKNKRVSPELTRRVQQAIEELNYRPNRLAKALAKKRTHVIGMMVPTIDNPFFPRLIRSVENTAASHGYSLFICNTDGSPERVRRYADRLIEDQVDGVLISLTWELADRKVIDSFLGAGIPVVGVAGARTVEGIDCVIPDDVIGAYSGTLHLISQGHESIAFIGIRESMTTTLRMKGMMRALEEAGLKFSDKLCILGEGYTQDAAYELGRELLDRGEPFTAILAYNDIFAVGVLNALADAGIDVPGDVSIISFDDTVSYYARPKITTIAINKEELGALAARRLCARIEGDDSPPRTLMLPPSIIVRDSTGPAPALRAHPDGAGMTGTAETVSRSG